MHLSWLHLAVSAAHAHASRDALLLSLSWFGTPQGSRTAGLVFRGLLHGNAERQLAHHPAPLIHTYDGAPARLDHIGAETELSKHGGISVEWRDPDVGVSGFPTHLSTLAIVLVLGQDSRALQLAQGVWDPLADLGQHGLQGDACAGLGFRAEGMAGTWCLVFRFQGFGVHGLDMFLPLNLSDHV